MRRAKTFDEFIELVGSIFLHADEANDSFHPRPTDIIISPFAKCGTTWLQQMVHSIRTGGDMDFEDIYEVVPWIDVAIELDMDLDAEQRAEPRAFKSHRPWDTVPKGCRYIVSFREPKDAAVSMFRFMEGWFIEQGAMTVGEFVERTALDREDGSDYWDHMVSWLARRDDPDVLLLTFEEMKQELRNVVGRVAEFMGVTADDDLLDVATHRSSFEFMSANRGPFEEPLLRAYSEETAGLPPHSDSTKVRTGEVGRNRLELSPELERRFDAIWDATIRAEFGYQRYEDLVADLWGGD